MNTGAPWVRVIVVNYNSGLLLQRCVDALATQSLLDFEAVIIDNGSTDGSIENLRLDSRFQLIRAGVNFGFAAACNLGTVGCETPWLATLNPDAEPRISWLEELRKATLRHPEIKVFGSTQIDAANPDRVDGFGDIYSVYGTAWRGASGRRLTDLPHDDREVFSPCAAAALYGRDLFEQIGGFDESLFCYLEDVDLGFRLRLQGHGCVQVRKAEVLHAGSAIAGRDSKFFVFFSQRNRIFVMIKNVPSPLLWLVLALQIAVVPATVLRRGIGNWRTAVRGIVTALRDLPRLRESRQDVQDTVTVSTWHLARMLVWDPRKALSQAPSFISSRESQYSA